MRALYLLLLPTLLAGCSVANYQRVEGPATVSVWGFEFGTDRALSGFTYKSATAEVGLESTQSVQTKALEAIVAGAIKGASLAVKP
jgi:hypothetical protein